MQLPEKYKENFDVSTQSVAPSNQTTVGIELGSQDFKTHVLTTV